MNVWPTPRPAVKTAITILAEAFAGSPLPSTVPLVFGLGVGAKMPKQRPPAFVRVSRVGGGQTNPRMDDARLLIECWAKTIGDAETMTSTVRAALRNAAGTTVDGVFIHGWGDEDGPVMYDDPDVSDMTRWQLTGSLSVSTR